MAGLSNNARALFEAPNLVWVTTMRADGSPHNTIVWADVEGDAVRFNTAQGRAKEKQLLNNANVSLSVLDPANAHHWASVSGLAEITTEGADDHIDLLAKKYLGADTYPGRTSAEVRVIVRVKPVHTLDSTG